MPRRLPPYLLIVIALASIGLTNCGVRRVDRDAVQGFVDQADAAARKRFAPEICALRSAQFSMQQRFHNALSPNNPTDLVIGRQLYCANAGKFAKLRQYVLERQSLDITIAPGAKSAEVTAHYIEKMPYYEDVVASTPDDYTDVQVLESVEHSVVGIENGKLVYLSSDVETTQSLVPKPQIPLPYD